MNELELSPNLKGEELRAESLNKKLDSAAKERVQIIFLEEPKLYFFSKRLTWLGFDRLVYCGRVASVVIRGFVEIVVSVSEAFRGKFFLGLLRCGPAKELKAMKELKISF